MAMLWMDGFQWVTTATSTALETIIKERYFNANLDAGGSKGSIAVGPGPSNGLVLGNTASDFLTIKVTGNPNEAYISFKVKCRRASNADTTDIIRVLNSAGGEQFSVNMGDNFTWHINTLGGTGGTQDRFNPLDFYPFEWNHIELHLVTNNTTGSYELRINGVEVSSATNIDTQNSTAGIDRYVLFSPTTNLDAGWIFRDIIIQDATGSANNSFAGEDLHVFQILPTADTADEDWALSAGTDSFDLIDDVDRVLSTYLESSTSGHRSLFDYANTGGETGIKALSINTTAALNSGTTGEDMRNVLDSNGTAFNGTTTSIAASATQAQVIDILETDPDTAAAWTSSAIDAITVGIEYV